MLRDASIDFLLPVDCAASAREKPELGQQLSAARHVFIDTAMSYRW